MQAHIALAKLILKWTQFWIFAAVVVVFNCTCHSKAILTY